MCFHLPGAGSCMRVSALGLSKLNSLMCCRGPGELLGRKQSGQAGLGCLRAAQLPGDTPLLEAARASAKAQLATLGAQPVERSSSCCGATRSILWHCISVAVSNCFTGCVGILAHCVPCGRLALLAKLTTCW